MQSDGRAQLMACMPKRRSAGLCNAEASCGRAVRPGIIIILLRQVHFLSCPCGRLALGAGRALLISSAACIACVCMSAHEDIDGRKDLTQLLRYCNVTLREKLLLRRVGAAP